MTVKQNRHSVEFPLIGILAAAFAIWLICHLLYVLGMKNKMARPSMEDDSDNVGRKFVESSIVERQS